MSVNHAAHMPQSLPSFAQAFSNSSLSSITSNSNALPPIQSQSYERTRHTTDSPPSQNDSRHPSVEQVRTSRKRSREEGSLSGRAEVDSDGHDGDDSRQSPKVVRIKEEDERGSPPQSPTPPAKANDVSHDPSPVPSTQPSPKRRRVTVSGPTQSSDSAAKPSMDHPASTPISPVIISLTSADDPTNRERPIMTVKPQQKAVVEQRRGSIAGVLSSTTPSSLAPGPSGRSPPEDHLSASKLTNLPRVGRRSPNESVGSSRPTGGHTLASGSQASSRMLSPPPIVVPSQQPATLNSSQVAPDSSSKAHQSPITHSLPPPPISFTTRRAAQSGGRKKKPADILISPRGTGPSDPLVPVIQSAPPIADRFPMAIPRLPFSISGTAQTTRRTAGNVPPTPTRFALRDAASTSINSTTRTGTASLSPPNPSVPIASSLVPLTPSNLHHPGNSGDKSAFLAPFEMFYDALNGSRQLKALLADQARKSDALLQSLKQQQEKLDSIVEDLVEKRTRAMREEIAVLRQRMESLEEAMQTGRGEAQARGAQCSGGSAHSHNSTGLQNGLPAGPEPSLSYRFPGTDQRRAEFTRGVPSPERPQDKEPQRSPPLVESSRRISISSGRPDATRMVTMEGGQFQGSFGPPGSHSRVGTGQPGSSKGTPPLRPQPIPERSCGARQPDQRAAPRLSYQALGNSDARSSSRSGDSRKNTVALEER
ncbi:hypothetical protein ID866_2322 [Astraeus odoratus]|nr:hypothetical protein ID866_2322 [Astraeus odoratus]